MGDSCFFVVFFVHADLLKLYLYDVPDASTSVSDTVFSTVDEFLQCCIRCYQCSVFVFAFPFGF